MNIHIQRVGNTDSAMTINYSTVGTGPRPATGADFQGGEMPSGSLSFLSGERSKTLALPLAPGAVPGHGVAINIEGAGVRPSSGPLAWTSTGNVWKCEAAIHQFDVVRPDDADHEAHHEYLIRPGADHPGSAAAPRPDGVVRFVKGQAATTLKTLSSVSSPRMFIFSDSPTINTLAWSVGPTVPRKTTRITAGITPPPNIGGTGSQARVIIEGVGDDPVTQADFWNGRFPVAQRIWIPSKARSSREFLVGFGLDATPGKAFAVRIEGVLSGYSLIDTAFSWSRDAESGD